MHTMSDKLSCKVGWPVLWAGGGEVADPSVPRCGAPYIALKQLSRDTCAQWQTSAAAVLARPCMTSVSKQTRRRHEGPES